MLYLLELEAGKKPSLSFTSEVLPASSAKMLAPTFFFLSLSRGPTGGAPGPSKRPPGSPGSQPMRRRVSFSNAPTLAAVVSTYL